MVTRTAGLTLVAGVTSATWLLAQPADVPFIEKVRSIREAVKQFGRI